MKPASVEIKTGDGFTIQHFRNSLVAVNTQVKPVSKANHFNLSTSIESRSITFFESSNFSTMARPRSTCDEFEPDLYVFTYVPSSGLRTDSGGRRPASISDDSSGNSDQDASASAFNENVSAPVIVDFCERDIDVEGHSSISVDSWDSDYEERLPNLSERLLSQGEGVVFDETWDETSEGELYKYSVKYAGLYVGSSSSSDGVDEEDEVDENPSSRWLSHRYRRHLFRLTLVEPTEDIPPISNAVIDHDPALLLRRPTKTTFYTRGQELRRALLKKKKEEDATSEAKPSDVAEPRFAKRRRCDPVKTPDIKEEDATSEAKHSDIAEPRFAKRRRFDP